MNDLQVFSRDVIPVYITDERKKVVIGRELHERLKIETPYTQWLDRMCEYGFTENQDYSSFHKKVKNLPEAVPPLNMSSLLTSHTDSGRDAQCWYDYYIHQAQEGKK